MKRILSVLTIICVAVTMFASFGVLAQAAGVAWYESFTKSGDVTTKGDTITLTSEPGETFGHAYRNNIPEVVKKTIDLEFDAQILKHNGEQHMEIYTGSHRFYIHFNLDHIWYRGYSASSAYESKRISYDIGYEKHHYRLITDGGYSGILYIDGYYAGHLSAEKNTQSPGRMELVAYGTNAGTSSVSFGNLVFNPYTGMPKYEGSEEETQTEEEIFGTLPNGDSYFDFENPEDYAGWSIRDTWEIKDGMMYGMNKLDLQQKSTYGPFSLKKGQDFTFTTRFRIEKFGEQQGIIISWPTGAFRAYVYADYIKFHTPHGQKRSELFPFKEGTWYEMKIQVTGDGTRNQLFIDGKPITSVEEAGANDGVYTKGEIYLFTYGNLGMPAGISMDWAKVELVHNELELIDPLKNAEFLEDEKIILSASVQENLRDEVPSVDYKINGKTVATGAAPDYLAELPGLPAGTYEITASGGDYVSPARTFSVIPGVLAEVQVSEDDYGNFFANLEFFDKGPQITKVEYRLDGRVVAESTKAPYYEMSLSALTPMRHTLEAICYNNAGVVVYENARQFTAKAVAAAASENFANEIRYKVSGETGNAEVKFGNGRHLLKMIHTPESVTYLTDEGNKTYDKGLGSFLVVTDGAFAEAYRNGQMVFTFVMPRSTEVVKEFADGGLTISDGKAIPSQDRATYFAMSNLTEKKSVYNLGSLPNYHVMDVALDVRDEGRIVLNDEYYRTDLKIKKGIVSVLTTKIEFTEPFLKEAGKLEDWADENGKVYLRAETALGMTRLYANGRWVFSFRSVPTVGDGTLAVEVAAGDGFEFLCVGDNQDVYYYEDEFSGDTRIPSLTQWRLQDNMSIAIDPDLQYLMLSATNQEDAIADISASLGEFDLSADVKVLEGTDGFWISLNHPVYHYYSKAGYNFKTGEFEIIDYDKGKTTTETAEGNFPVGEFVKLAVKVRQEESGKRVELYLNGDLVLTKKDSSNHRGRAGFALTNGTAYVDNLSLRGDAKVVADIRDVWSTNGTMDMIDLGNDSFVLTHGSAAWKTTDGGRSFQKDTEITPMSDDVITLQNGEVLALKSEVQYIGEDGRTYRNFIPYISQDQGKTYQRVGTDKVSEKDHIGLHHASMQNRVKQGPSGRIYAACETEVATEWVHWLKVFYSDDNGRTWNDSETVIKSTELGSGNNKPAGTVFCEVVPLELADGSVYLFGRTSLGYIGYIKSYDGGKTFDTEHIYTTPFLSTENCYNIEVDPYDSKTVYAVFGYDNDNLSGMGQYPRTRWTIAKSSDSMQTWQILGTLYENNHMSVPGAMMNLNLNITENLLVAEAFSTDDFNGSLPGARIITIPKNAQVGSNRFEQIHLKYPEQAEITRVVSMDQIQKSLVLHPESETALLHNKKVEAASYGDFVALDVAAAFVGASASREEDGSVTLSILGSKVPFPATDSIEHNGKRYLKTDAFAKAYGLFVEEERGIRIISPFEEWGYLQKESIRFSLDYFSKER